MAISLKRLLLGMTEEVVRVLRMGSFIRRRSSVGAGRRRIGMRGDIGVGGDDRSTTPSSMRIILAIVDSLMTSREAQSS